MLSLEGKQLGNYDVIRRIRSGGMGAVYEGRQRTAFDRRVAIKVILGDYAADRDMRRRFAREAKTIARLHHPHILQLIEFGDAQGILYLVMPFIDGGTLTSYLRRNLPELSEVSAIYQQLLDAVEYAHEAGLIHRDIKSSNVLLEIRRNAPPYIYLADFGLVRTMRHDDSSQPGKPIPLDQVPGTPHYMAPEQTLGIVTPLTDIYALGVLLYQMLTGNLPYNDPNEVSVIEMHLYAPIPSPCDQDASIPFELGEVVRKAMAKQPEERYRNVAELREAFLAALSGPILTSIYEDTTTFPDPPVVILDPEVPIQLRTTNILNKRPIDPPEPIIMPRRAAPRTDSRPPLGAREVRERVEKTIKTERVYTTDTIRPRVRITEEPQQKRWFPLLATVVSIVLILLLVLPRWLGINIIPASIPLLGSSALATVSITAQSSPIQNTFLLTASPLVKTPDLYAHTVPDRVIKNSVSDSVTVPTTGVQTTPGGYASGVLELTNGTGNTVTVERGTQFPTGNGVSVQLQQSVDVPGQDNNGQPGQANVLASAVQPGPAGNIAPNALKTTCCNDAISIQNPAAFVGGSDPKITHYVTQADLDGAQATLSQRLQQLLSTQAQKQIAADEVIVGQPDFKVVKVNPNHAINDSVDNVTVSVNAEGSTTVYKRSVVEQTAMVLLSREAAKMLSAAYQLQGKPTLIGMPSVQSVKDGIVHLNVTVRGIWTYGFTDQQIQQLRVPIKGASIDLAKTYLKTQPGIANVDIHLPFGTDHLPSSVDDIAISVAPLAH
jgi:serine/threonine protein kinase